MSETQAAYNAHNAQAVGYALILASACEIAYMLAKDPRIKSQHTERLYKSALADFNAWRCARELTNTLV